MSNVLSESEFNKSYLLSEIFDNYNDYLDSANKIVSPEVCKVCKKSKAEYKSKEENLCLCKKCAIEYANITSKICCTYCKKFSSSHNAVFIDNTPYCSVKCALKSTGISEM